MDIAALQPPEFRARVYPGVDSARKLRGAIGPGGPRELTDAELEAVAGGTDTIIVTYPDGCELEVAVQGSIWDTLDWANLMHRTMHTIE